MSGEKNRRGVKNWRKRVQTAIKTGRVDTDLLEGYSMEDIEGRIKHFEMKLRKANEDIEGDGGAAGPNYRKFHDRQQWNRRQLFYWRIMRRVARSGINEAGPYTEADE